MTSVWNTAGISDSFFTLSVRSKSRSTSMSPHLSCVGFSDSRGPIPTAMHWISSGSSSCPTIRKNIGSCTFSNRSVVNET
eukprot:494130-Rhodomonas_salina.1